MTLTGVSADAMRGAVVSEAPESITRDELADYLESVNGQRRDRAEDLASGAFEYAKRNREPEGAEMNAAGTVPVDSGRALPTPPESAQDGAGASSPGREALGRLVHDTRLAVTAERGSRFVMQPWEQRVPDQQELDMRIGEAVAAAVREADGAKLAEVRSTVAAFLTHYGNSQLPSFKVALDLAHGVQQVLDRDSGTEGARP